ncbi:MAG: nuclear transport factor 2 family protein [Gammaproteobacteria bacterium]|nr:nuclear transport factor 2 family protein [Gammaproteobacteria bacterium]
MRTTTARSSRRATAALATLLLAALAALAAISPAGAREPDALRQLRDRHAIEALMWRYARTLDTLDPDGYAATYTSDGRFTAGGLTVTGGAALRQMIDGYRQRRAEQRARGEPDTPPMHHIITNTHIEFLDRDHARQEAYWMTVFEGQGEAQAPRVAAAGRSVDELVRVDGRWLIRTRDVTPRD